MLRGTSGLDRGALSGQSFGSIAQREASMLRWSIGILAVAGIGLAVALIRTLTGGMVTQVM